MVPVGIFERPEQLEVNIRLLGCLCHEIEACLEPRRLLLRAQKEEVKSQKPGEESHTEQRLNGIFIALHLPDQVDPAKVTATFKDGNLWMIEGLAGSLPPAPFFRSDISRSRR